MRWARLMARRSIWPTPRREKLYKPNPTAVSSPSSASSSFSSSSSFSFSSSSSYPYPYPYLSPLTSPAPLPLPIASHPCQSSAPPGREGRGLAAAGRTKSSRQSSTATPSPTPTTASPVLASCRSAAAPCFRSNGIAHAVKERVSHASHTRTHNKDSHKGAHTSPTQHTQCTEECTEPHAAILTADTSSMPHAAPRAHPLNTWPLTVLKSAHCAHNDLVVDCAHKCSAAGACAGLYVAAIMKGAHTNGEYWLYLAAPISKNDEVPTATWHLVFKLVQNLVYH